MNPLLIISDYLLADRRILSRDLILNLTLTLCSYLNSNSYSISPHVLQFSGGPRTTQIIVPLVVSTPSWRKLPPTITSIVTVSPRPVWQERNQNQNRRHSNSNLTKPWKSSFSSGFLAFQCVGITQVMGGVHSGGSLPMSVLKGHHPLETPPWPGHKESALYAVFWLTGDQRSWRNKSRRLWRGLYANGSACQCRRHRLDLWFGTSPHATGQLSPVPQLLSPWASEPALTNKRSHHATHKSRNCNKKPKTIE